MSEPSETKFRYSPSTKGWYPRVRVYPNLPDDLIDVDDDLYEDWVNSPGATVEVVNGMVSVHPFEEPPVAPQPVEPHHEPEAEDGDKPPVKRAKS